MKHFNLARKKKKIHKIISNKVPTQKQQKKMICHSVKNLNKAAKQHEIDMSKQNPRKSFRLCATVKQ
jgi:hypothetical protein